MNSLILATATRIITALILVFSVYMLLRGHNLPGGGFIGGLIAVTAFGLYALAHGVQAAQQALWVNPASLAMVGLGVAIASVFFAVPHGEPPMTGQWLFIGGGEGDKGVPLSSVLVFDIGVYLVVVGAVLSILFAMEEEG